MAIFLLIGYTTYFVSDIYIGFFPSTVFLLMHIGALILSWQRKIRLSFLVFTVTVNAAIFFINQQYPREVGAYLYYFPLIVSIVLLNNPSFKDRYTVLHVGLCGLFLLANLFIEIPGFRLTSLAAEKISTIWYYNLIISAATTGVLCFLLSRLISQQSREIMNQNKSLTEAQQAVTTTLREKEVLLAELHHRVKNNLAIISGLLNLQGDATSNDEARQIIGDSKNRILSMALVHRMLFENPNLKSINVGRYSTELIRELFYTYNLQKTVDLVEDYDDIVLPVGKSIPLGLILNEIVTNSIKYAFRGQGREKGQFSITIKKQEPNRVLLTAIDNGAGFPENYDFNAPSLSLGIFLIKTLTEQIEGTVSFSNEHGARIELDFLHH